MTYRFVRVGHFQRRGCPSKIRNLFFLSSDLDWAEVIQKMKTERRVAIYGRVSTNTGQNPEMQIRELRDYCKNRSWKIVGEFVDSGISGATDSRPQLNTSDGRCTSTPIRRGSGLGFLAVCPVNFSFASSTRNIFVLRDWFRFAQRTNRYWHSNRQNGFHDSWQRCGTGTLA